jgi:aspartate/glutamate racemase
MKVIGLISGMSWESSAEYYHIINETTKGLCRGRVLSEEVETISKVAFPLKKEYRKRRLRKQS